jgi:hypothetical protein
MTLLGLTTKRETPARAQFQLRVGNTGVQSRASIRRALKIDLQRGLLFVAPAHRSLWPLQLAPEKSFSFIKVLAFWNSNAVFHSGSPA